MRRKGSLIFLFVCFAPFSMPRAFALDCQPYWTAQYKCMMGCGCGGGGYVPSGPSQEQLQQQREEAARVEREREEELERQRQEAENKRHQEELESQARFIADRNAAAGTLKGAVGTPTLSSGTNALGLKDGLTDTGIKNLQSDQKSRDLEGRHAAWKQLHCAAAIASDALSALQSSLSDPARDMSEFKYLSGEAANALNGNRLGVECPAAPPYPSPKGKEIDMEKGKAVTQKILDRAAAVADRIAKTAPPSTSPSETATPKSTASGSDDDLAKLRAQQIALNRNQERKYDPSSQASINREQKTKKEITHLILDTKKVETGDFSISLDGAKP